jgi:ATP-dependent 26S proteasome regulatory subunit
MPSHPSAHKSKRSKHSNSPGVIFAMESKVLLPRLEVYLRESGSSRPDLTSIIDFLCTRWPEYRRRSKSAMESLVKQTIEAKKRAIKEKNQMKSSLSTNASNDNDEEIIVENSDSEEFGGELKSSDNEQSDKEENQVNDSNSEVIELSSLSSNKRQRNENEEISLVEVEDQNIPNSKVRLLYKGKQEKHEKHEKPLTGSQKRKRKRSISANEPTDPLSSGDPSTTSWHPELHHSFTTYEDVGGIEGILQEIREQIEYPIRHPELYSHLGVDPPRGVLLHGAPGTGNRKNQSLRQ